MNLHVLLEMRAILTLTIQTRPWIQNSPKNIYIFCTKPRVWLQPDTTLAAIILRYLYLENGVRLKVRPLRVLNEKQSAPHPPQPALQVLRL